MWAAWIGLGWAAPPARWVEVGADAGRGNVVAVQAWVEEADYASAGALEQRLAGWLDGAKDRGWLSPSTVVVLPEYVGTWLVAVGEPEKVRAAPTAGQALAKVAKRRLFRYLAARGDVAEDRATYGLFALKADEMAAAYQQVMGGLAGRYGVTLVAGSILLPEPALQGGRITTTPGGPLRNAAFVFGPDGGAVGAVIKSFPTADEQGFVAGGDPAALPVFPTPVGPLGVLVCADGWFPAAWDALQAAGAAWVVVPQYTSGDGHWTVPWGGYSGWPAPPDVDRADEQVLTEAEAWARYGPTGRGAARGLSVVTVPLRGDLWDLGDDGQARWVVGGVAGEGPLVDGPVVVNLWAPPAPPEAWDTAPRSEGG